MNDKQVQLFLSVVDQGSFSKAESVEYMSKQAILRQINALEAEVGTELLRRSADGVTLTSAGEEFYRGAQEFAKLREEVLSRCRNAPAVQPFLRIGQVEHQALLHEVTDLFVVKYPDIRIQKVIHPNHSGEYRVANDIVDVGETFYTEITARETFAYTKLVDLPYVAVMAQEHPLSSCDRIPLNALAPYETSLFEQMTPSKYLSAIQSAFVSSPEHLTVRRDVDHQVAAAYACVSSERIFITANYFVHSMPELKAIPLDAGWT